MSGTNQHFEWESEAAGSDAGKTLSTGMDVLDRKFGGGIPAGTMIALAATPASQSELFLYQMAAVRETVYLSSERTVTDLEQTIRQTETPLDTVEIHQVAASDPLGDAWPVIEELSEQSTLIVDPIDQFESTAESEYRAFLNELRTKTAETESLSLLHCLKGRQVSTQRDRTEYLADIVFDLITERRGDSIENSLSVPKFRGGEALAETVALDLTSDVTIDVSRNIA